MSRRPSPCTEVAAVTAPMTAHAAGAPATPAAAKLSDDFNGVGCQDLTVADPRGKAGGKTRAG
ncbi:hypothetical protein [Streptomyces sp. NPDC050416]|uniref:hypothetical protein n=1 Tax=Streptomyces sp. NPDC050416 TaxID=3365611 RepID=UPI0037A353A5